MRLAPLMEAVEPATPSTDLFSRIAAEAGIAAPLPGFHVTDRDEGAWKTIAEGVETRTLWLSRRSGRRSFVVRMQPGAILPEHDHGGDEECYVLEGDMQVDGVPFGPGDFQVAFAGTRHPLVTTRAGCLCLLSVGL
jgi:anti-sigma factor ChrR (cupin superfamily)